MPEPLRRAGPASRREPVRSRAVPRLVGVLVAVLTLGGLLTTSGCSGAGGVASGGCAPVHHDLLDVRSTLHLLPGAPEPPYLTDPPTSGAHRVGYYPRGVVATPIARPTQVALLEKGFVVVQYRSSLGPAAQSALAQLTDLSPYVTVSPDPTLPDPVVATSWFARPAVRRRRRPRPPAAARLRRPAHRPGPRAHDRGAPDVARRGHHDHDASVLS